MIAEITAALGSAKLAMDIAKGASQISDGIERQAEVTKLLSVIQELQEKLIALGEKYDELSRAKREAEEKVHQYESWGAEASRYESVETSAGTFVYRLKATDPDYQESKKLCATCFDSKKKSVLQRMNPRERAYRCGLCQNVILA